MNPRESIWSRMNAVERRAATTAYLIASDGVPIAFHSAVAVLARETRTRPRTVARWSLDRRAERLARMVRWDPPFLAAVIAAFHVRCRAPLVAEFLDLAGIPHDGGILGPAALGAAFPDAQLAHAVAKTRSEFDPRDVDLYLDALEAQQLPSLAGLASARGEAAPPNSASCGGP